MEFEKADPRLVGERLTSARRVAGITQADAATHLGISRPTLIAIEKGLREAKPEEIMKLASLYGRSVHELVRAGSATVDLEPHLRAALNPEERDSQGLVASISEMADLANDYRELERLLSAPLKVEHPPEVVLPSRGNIVEFAEDIAQRERNRLQLGNGPIGNLREALENCVGVRVFLGSMPKGFSGMYAYASDLGYCIFLNSRHPRTRRDASLAHEYGHFLCDRHRPGVDRTNGDERKPRNEQFCDAFAMGFLLPRASVRPFFFNTFESTGDFQVADLVRLSSFFQVSLEAAARRLEALGLVGRGTWEMLKEQGISPKAARERLGLGADESQLERLPDRYRMLAVKAYLQGLISESQLAKYLRCDRIAAREIVEKLSGQVVNSDEQAPTRQLPLNYSLFG